MRKLSFPEAMAQILKEDPRFSADAYLFVREALDFTTKLMKKPSDGPDRHVTGADLLDGIRQFALQEYGPMSMTVFASWGIHTCTDFGHIVFNLVNKGILGKTDEDSIHDFANGYEFATAFRTPFAPPKAPLRHKQPSQE